MFGFQPLDGFHSMTLTILFPWQHSGLQTSPILKANGLHFFEILKAVCKGLEKSELPWKRN